MQCTPLLIANADWTICSKGKKRNLNYLSEQGRIRWNIGGRREDSVGVFSMPASAFLLLKRVLSIAFHPISQRQGASVQQLG